MQIQFQTSGLSDTDKKLFESYATKKFEKLKKMLKKFDPDTTFLHLSVEYVKKHNAFILKAKLELPGHNIHHEDAKHNLQEVVDLCYDNIHLQIVKDKEKHSRPKR